MQAFVNLLEMAIVIVIGASYFFYFRYKENKYSYLWTFGLLPIGMVGMFSIMTGLNGYVSFGEWLFYCWFVGALLMIIPYMRDNSPDKSDDDIRRGAQIISEAALIKSVKKSKEETHAFIGSVPVPVRNEPYHFLLAGGTGSGKSLAFNQLMVSARNRKQKGLVADAGGNFIKNFYGRKGSDDIILNPLDARVTDWSPFAEMRNSFDSARIAASMIPAGSGESSEWNGYARSIVEALLSGLFEAGGEFATNQSLCYYSLAAPADEVKTIVDGTPAIMFFQEGNERMLGSVRSILASYLKAYTYLKPEAGVDSFSLRNWVEDEESDAFVFLSYRDDQLEAIRPLIAAQIDIVASAVLSLSASPTRRVWLFLDEFASLGKVNGIEPFLTKARKNGGCCVAGLQSISQLRSAYGRDQAQTLLSCLTNSLILSQNDTETAEYMSKYIGDQEIRRMTGGGSSSSGGGSSSWNEQISRQKAVMGSELQALQPRVGILNLAGNWTPGWVCVPITALENKNECVIDLKGAKQMKLLPPSRNSSGGSNNSSANSMNVDEDEDLIGDLLA